MALIFTKNLSSLKTWEAESNTPDLVLPYVAELGGEEVVVDPPPVQSVAQFTPLSGHMARKLPATLRPYSAQIDKHYRDDEGHWWVDLAPGWIIPYDGTHGVTETTLRLCAMKLANAEPCQCAECLTLIAKATA